MGIQIYLVNSKTMTYQYVDKLSTDWRKANFQNLIDNIDLLYLDDALNTSCNLLKPNKPLSIIEKYLYKDYLIGNSIYAWNFSTNLLNVLKSFDPKDFKYLIIAFDMDCGFCNTEMGQELVHLYDAKTIGDVLQKIVNYGAEIGNQ